MTHNPLKYAVYRDRYDWCAFDLDSTLAYYEKGLIGIGAPIEAGVNKLLECEKDGKTIIIHTARAWADYINIKNWLDDYKVPYDMIVCGKLGAGEYYDDRNKFIEGINKGTNEPEQWLTE